MKVSVQKLPHARDLPLPAHATAGSAGLDVIAAVEKDIVLAPGGRAAIPTGIAIALPQGFEAQIRPRSGLALKHGITILNAPGTIDSDYRGEVHAIVANLGRESFTVSRGMKIAQLVVARTERVEWDETELDETDRGAGGFGSTGMKMRT